MIIGIIIISILIVCLVVVLWAGYRPLFCQQNAMRLCFKEPVIGQRALSQIRDKFGIKKYKIISFSLYGDKDKYILGAYENAHLARLLYPGWICRFYYGPTVPKNVIAELDKLPNVELRAMNKSSTKKTNASGMMWRFAPAFVEPEVDVMIVRDSDSRLMKREVEAVNEWLKSDKDFHIMRDHPHHQEKIMGGMWGCRNGALLSFKKAYLEYLHNGRYGDDQNFLAKQIYPKIKKNAMIHVGNNGKIYEEDPEVHPFPSMLKSPHQFVGAVVSTDFRYWKKKDNV